MRGRRFSNGIGLALALAAAAALPGRAAADCGGVYAECVARTVVFMPGGGAVWDANGCMAVYVGCLADTIIAA